MKSLGRYRVVGVRDDGERIVISCNDTREIAEKVVRLIRQGSGFKELIIEDGPDNVGKSAGR